MKYEYNTSQVCAQKICFDLQDNVVTDIHFEGGCPGNLKAISKLLEGSTIEHVESLLLGNTCLNKTTSCTDQLAIALQKARDGQLEALPQA